MRGTQLDKLWGAVGWRWVLAGILVYVVLGAAVKQIPNPMLPEAILALTMVVPVVAGYFGGTFTGALVGLLGTTLNFLLQIPFAGPDAFEAAAILPNAIMGAFAGWVGQGGSRIATALTIFIGHGLKLVTFLLLGLLPGALLATPVFWTGLLAEATVDLILISLFIGLIQQTKRRGLETAVARMGWRRFFLAAGSIVLLLLMLMLAFILGVPLAGHLFVIPVILAVLTLGSFEATLVALLPTLFLGAQVVQLGLDSAELQLSLILTLNLVALSFGELAGHVQRQRRLAQNQLLELEQAYSALSEADQLKSEMIQNISHELRTPLAIILGYSELLATGAIGELSEEQHRAVHSVWEHGRKLAYLVEQITVLHQAEQGNLSWQTFNLETLARNCVDQIYPLAQRQRCQINLSLSGDLPAIEGDVHCLGRVIHALLDNAIKFSPQGGVIGVAVWWAVDRTCLAVTDQGIGIPPDKQALIFNRFYQVDGSAKRQFSGMGTGLALVKEVAQAHGGDVWVESLAGQGSTLGFWLPLKPPDLMEVRETMPALWQRLVQLGRQS